MNSTKKAAPRPVVGQSYAKRRWFFLIDFIEGNDIFVCRRLRRGYKPLLMRVDRKTWNKEMKGAKVVKQ